MKTQQTQTKRSGSRRLPSCRTRPPTHHSRPNSTNHSPCCCKQRTPRCLGPCSSCRRRCSPCPCGCLSSRAACCCLLLLCNCVHIHHLIHSPGAHGIVEQNLQFASQGTAGGSPGGRGVAGCACLPCGAVRDGIMLRVIDAYGAWNGAQAPASCPRQPTFLNGSSCFMQHGPQPLPTPSPLFPFRK